MKEVCAFSETRRALRIKDSELLGEVLVSEYNLCKKGVKITRYDQRIFDHREDRSKSSCSLPPLWSWRIIVIRPPDTRPPEPGRRRTGTEVVTCSRFRDPMGLHQSLWTVRTNGHGSHSDFYVLEECWIDFHYKCTNHQLACTDLSGPCLFDLPHPRWGDRASTTHTPSGPRWRIQITAGIR